MMTPMKRTLPAILLLALAFPVAFPASSIPLVSDDFDTEPTGGKPSGYRIEEAGGGVSVAEVPGAGDKSLYLNDPGSSVIRVMRSFDPQTGIVTAEARFMQPALGTTAKAFRLLNGDGTAAAVHLETRKEGDGNVISYKGVDGSFVTLAPYAAKVWVTLRIVADVAAQKADVYVDGVLKVGAQPFTAAVKEIGAFDSYTPGSSAKGHYIDGIRIWSGRVEAGKPPGAVSSAAPGAVQGSDLIRGLEVLDAGRAGFWAVRPAIRTGDMLFGDRSYTLSSLPASLAGHEYIMPACDSKNWWTDPLVEFTLGADATVFVAHDDRLTVKPAWLSGWTDSGEDAVDDEANPVTYSLFGRAFPAGSRVTLGNNGGSSGCTQYFVIVKGPGAPAAVTGGPKAVTTSAPIVWDAAMRQGTAWYAGSEAARVGDNVLLYQRDAGGWPKNLDMARELSDADRAVLAGLKADPGDCTIDNAASTTQIRFLARVYGASGLERFRDGALKGIDWLLAAQYGNGGWPQYWPRTEGYYARITFNDNAMCNVLALLTEARDGAGDFPFLDAARRSAAGEAVRKGIDCILRCQVRVDGRLTAWCAQHDERTLAPAQARAYELPSLSGSESVGIVRFLMTAAPRTPQVKEAVEAACAWLAKVKITGIRVIDKPDASLPGGIDKVVVAEPGAAPVWARFYEIGTDRPFFCGRDGVKKYGMAEIEHERRTGYSWYVNAPAYLLDVELPKWRSGSPR